MTRKDKIKVLLTEYRAELGNILEVGSSFDTTRLPKFIADCTNLVTAKTPSFSSIAALNTLNFGLGHVIGQTRTYLADPTYSSDPIGLGIYSVTISSSGKGKSSSTDALVDRTKSSALFRVALLRVEQERSIPMLDKARKLCLAALQKDEESVTMEVVTDAMAQEYMEPLTRNAVSDDSSRGGITSILAELQREEFGAIALTMDEFGMSIKSGQTFEEVTKLLTSNYDLGKINAPAYKTKELVETDIEGSYINLLAHTSPGGLFESDLMKSKVSMLFSSSFARRVWLVFPNDSESYENNEVPNSIKESRSMSNARRTTLAMATPDVSAHMEEIVDNLLTNPEARVLKFSEEASKLYIDYFEYNTFKSELIDDSKVLQKLELSGRAWRCGKLVGVWSASIGEQEISVDTLKSVIYFAEYTSKYIIKLERTLAAKNYEALADSLKENNSMPIATALTRNLIIKASPLIIQETLTAMNSYLNSSAVITYDKELNSFIYEELIVVTAPVAGQPSTFTMSYNIVKEPRTFADAPDEFTDKQKADWVKEPRTHLLAEFTTHRDNLQYINLINLVTKDTVFNVFKYGPGSTKKRPDVLLDMYRSNGTIISKSNLIIIDVDDSEVPLDVIAEFLTDRQYLIATSSNKLNRNKFRILLPINVELDGTNTTQYAYIVRRICADLLIEADPKSFCPSQAWYGYADSDYLLQDTGPLFDVTEYLVELAKAEPTKPTKKLHIDRTDKAQKTHMNKLFSNVDSEFMYALNPPQGQGSYTLARACLHLIDEGATAEEMEKVILYLNSCWDSPMPVERIERTLLSGYSTRCKVV